MKTRARMKETEFGWKNLVNTDITNLIVIIRLLFKIIKCGCLCIFILSSFTLRKICIQLL